MTGRGEGRNRRIWRKGGVGRDREKRECKRREGKEERKKKKKNQDTYKRLQRFRPEHPFLPRSIPPLRVRGNSQRGSFPLALGVQGRAVPRGSRLPGPAPRRRRRRLLAARRLRAGDGVASGASALRSATERAEAALARRVPSPLAAEPSRCTWEQDAEEAGGLTAATRVYPLEPRISARTSQGEGKK